jgi:AGZA family xanthine/uracil permease-like MFS transporter
MPAGKKQFRMLPPGLRWRTELTAGCTTFAAMAYILAVNPAILSAAGMDIGAVITATALASAIMTAIMAVATNYPIALAPGMGMNAFFAYTICVGMKIPWPAALGMVFCSGALFLLLSVTGARQKIIEAIPLQLKVAISGGIGLFIIFIGLKNGGIVATDPMTFVKVGELGQPATLLVLFGILLTSALIFWKVRGAIILSVLAITLIGLFIPNPDGSGRLSQWPEQFVAMPASLAPTFLALDLGYVFENFRQAWPLILTLLFVDLFDNMGTLIAVSHRAGLLDEQGRLPKIGPALMADASAAMVGSVLGTSTVTSYIESAAGVEEGGRTGLTALVVSACFLAALFFHPVIRMIPTVATAPALVVVGVFMVQGITQLDLSDFTLAVPAILLVVLMPLTFSISEGLAIGFLLFVLLKIMSGRAREVSWFGYALGAVFLWHVLRR